MQRILKLKKCQQYQYILVWCPHHPAEHMQKTVALSVMEAELIAATSNA